MNAEILAVGTELLLGDILNTNAQYLARELASLGINVLHQSVVGDNAERLSQAFRESFERSDIVITTGGLGPTGDDITREVVSESLGLPLFLDIRSLQRIQSYFNKTGRTMTENNQKQAMLPQGATIFQNDWGTAPACAVNKNGKVVIMLPGPPREMAPLFEKYVRPYLIKYSDSIIVSSSLRVFGIGESAVEDRISDMMKGSNPTLAPYAKEGEVLLRITARAKSETEARLLILPVEHEIKRRLGHCVYGENVDSLQQVVVEKLREKKLKLGIAESCTGGLVSKRITEIPGSSEVFDCCIVSYSNTIKENVLGVKKKTLENFGAVSEQTAAEMAEGARKVAKADIGVGITGIAGPGGGTEEKPVGLVFVAVSDGESCFVKRLSLGRTDSERDYIRFVSASHALDMVRRLIDGIEQGDGCVSVKMPGTSGWVFPWAQKAASDENEKKTKGQKFKRFLRNTFPMKGDSKKQIALKILFLVAVIVFVVSFWQIGSYVLDYFYTNSKYSNLTPPSSSMGTNADQTQKSFDNLLSQNKDTKGYLIVPNTHIKYPVVEASDNNYYLRRSFWGKSDRHGVPFIDCICTVKQPMSQNLIIFGHNMQDTLMFHDLTDYQNLSFYEKSPVITFDTIYKNYKWKVFAAFITTADYNYLIPSFKTDADFNNYIIQIKRRSFINTAVDIKPGDHILTLSTCDYDFDNARFVVEARMIRPGEDESVGVATKNQNPLMPAIWYQTYGGTPPVFSSNSATVATQAAAPSAKASSTVSKPSSAAAPKASSVVSKAPAAASSSKAETSKLPIEASGSSSKASSSSKESSKPSSSSKSSSKTSSKEESSEISSKSESTGGSESDSGSGSDNGGSGETGGSDESTQ